MCRRLRRWRRSAAPTSARGTMMTAQWPHTRRKRRARRGEKSSRPRWRCPRTPRHAATTLWAKGVCEVKSANSNTSYKRDAGTRVEGPGVGGWGYGAYLHSNKLGPHGAVPGSWPSSTVTPGRTPMPGNNSSRSRPAIEPRHRPPGQRWILDEGLRGGPSLLAHAEGVPESCNGLGSVTFKKKKHSTHTKACPLLRRLPIHEPKIHLHSDVPQTTEMHRLPTPRRWDPAGPSAVDTVAPSGCKTWVDICFEHLRLQGLCLPHPLVSGLVTKPFIELKPDTPCHESRADTQQSGPIAFASSDLLLWDLLRLH